MEIMQNYIPLTETDMKDLALMNVALRSAQININDKFVKVPDNIKKVILRNLIIKEEFDFTRIAFSQGLINLQPNISDLLEKAGQKTIREYLLNYFKLSFLLKIDSTVISYYTEIEESGQVERSKRNITESGRLLKVQIDDPDYFEGTNLASRLFNLDKSRYFDGLYCIVDKFILPTDKKSLGEGDLKFDAYLIEREDVTLFSIAQNLSFNYKKFMKPSDFPEKY